MRTVCIIQARMGSTRLPGKVAALIAGEPMLARVVARAARISGVDEVVVATSTAEADQRIVELASDCRVPVYRGPELDVLERYVLCARERGAEAVMRVTSDCPLLDVEVSGMVLARFAAERPDYCANTLERTYPRGLDTEVLTIAALETAHAEATSAADREHVTLFVQRQPERFSLRSVTGDADHSGHRWTVDMEADLELVRRIYDALGSGDWGYREVLELLECNPGWREINAHVEQKPA